MGELQKSQMYSQTGRRLTPVVQEVQDVNVNDVVKRYYVSACADDPVIAGWLVNPGSQANRL